MSPASDAAPVAEGWPAERPGCGPQSNNGTAHKIDVSDVYAVCSVSRAALILVTLQGGSVSIPIVQMRRLSCGKAESLPHVTYHTGDSVSVLCGSLRLDFLPVKMQDVEADDTPDAKRS